MALLREYARLLAAAPGSTVYHLVTLFASQIILGIALVAWRQRRESPFTPRLLALAATFALTRVVLVAVAGLDQAGLLSGQAVAPPLERFLDFATLFVSIWAFLPVLIRYRRIGMILLAAGLALGAGIYVVSAFLWLRRILEGSFYNHYWQSSTWEVLNIAILVPTLFVAALSRRDDWGLLACLFALWLAGHSLEYAAPIVDSNAAAWTRLANLVAAPVFAALVYRSALREPPPRRPGFPAPLVRALATLSLAEQRGDIEAGLRSAASALASALDADTLALTSVVHNQSDPLHIVALHPPDLASHLGQEISVSAQGTHALHAALGPKETGAKAYLAPAADAGLFASLGYDGSGPLLVHPLRASGVLVGAILAGNPVSQRDWKDSDRLILEAAGPALAAALAAGHHADDRNVTAELRAARRHEAELARRVTELEEHSKQHDGRLAAVSAGRDQYRHRAEELAARLRRYEEREQTAGVPQPVSTGPADLRAVVADAAASFAERLRERKLILRQDVEPGLPPVEAGRDSTTRIIAAVLRGARLAAAAGSEIVVRARRAAADEDAELPLNSVLIAVSYVEQGAPAGLAAAQAELAAARGLVQTLEGLVWIEREPAGQTTFSFTLPTTVRGPQARPTRVGGQGT